MRVERDYLEARLGLVAWLVWERMVRLRSPEGLFWGSVERMRAPKGQKPITLPTIRRALMRLTEAGLIYQPPGAAAGRYDGADGHGGLGFQTGPRGRRIFIRRVLGDTSAPSTHVGRAVCDVPPKTLLWLAEEPLYSHGGKRAGAGRPMGAKNVPRDPRKNQDEPQGGSHLKIQDEPHPRKSSEHKVRSLTLSALVLGEDAAHPPAATPSALVKDEAPRVPPHGVASEGEGAWGTRLGGHSQARPVFTLTGPLKGVPPYPGASLTGSVRIPGPPKLHPDASERERADTLADAYRRVLEARTGERCWVLRGAVTKSKHYPLLVQAAALMLEHQISPAAWVAWSVDQWRASRDQRRPPPLSFVFGGKRIVERRGWFASESIDYAGGRVIVGPKRAALIDTYMQMRRAIDALGAWQEPAPVVERFFPGNSFERELAAVRVEVVREQANLRVRVEAGEVFW